LSVKPIRELQKMPQPREGAPTVYIETYGCQMNVYDSSAIFGLLGGAGFAIGDDPLTADVVLINTCSVRDHAEHKVLSRVGELRRDREEAGSPPAVLGILGCMAERLGKTLTENRQRLDVVVGVDGYQTLPGILEEKLAVSGPAHPAVVTGHRDDVHYVAPPQLYPQNGSHLITIHKGCDYKCTYCIVPYTRGPQREKAPAAILAEVRTIVEAGGREVTLLGQNVTAYKWRDELDFAGLLQDVARVDGLERIRFLTGHPRDMHERLMDVIGAEPKVCPGLHVPGQTGSDRVLKRMKRLYQRADYLHMVEYARRVIPDVTLSGDIIVGFPGETEDDFALTLSLIREVGYDTLFSYKYSERPGAPAARLVDDVPEDVKKRRLAEVMAVQDETWQGIGAAQVGRVWDAVAEEPARRPQGSWRLRTPNNRKILVPLAEPVVGRSYRVQVDSFRNTSFFGHLV
jgi:tRNA-2-methylthio-N6-dimethylallyladenosine synthase